jgi:hypothetical protein
MSLKIESLEQLEELLRVCHRQGVHAIKVDGVELALSPIDPNAPKQKVQTDPLADMASALSGMSDEDIALWSAR